MFVLQKAKQSEVSERVPSLKEAADQWMTSLDVFKSMDEIERKIRDKREAIIIHPKTTQNKTKRNCNAFYGLFSFSLVSAVSSHLFTSPLNNGEYSIGPMFFWKIEQIFAMQ